MDKIEQKQEKKPQTITFRKNEIVTIKGIKVQIIKVTGNSMSVKFLGDRYDVKVLK